MDWNRISPNGFRYAVQNRPRFNRLADGASWIRHARPPVGPDKKVHI
jgi:hypothetical protein